MKKKVDIKVDKIFSYEGDESRKLVLVEGAPGVGKTMLVPKNVIVLTELTDTILKPVQCQSRPIKSFPKEN